MEELVCIEQCPQSIARLPFEQQGKKKNSGKKLKIKININNLAS
jgi:hypothetical protein